MNARALLLCNVGGNGPGWNVSGVAEALGISCRTIEHLKKRFVEEGLEGRL
jgi:transposase